jgi:hypothetical protein
MTLITPPSGLRLRQLKRWAFDLSTPTSGRGLDGRQQFIRRESRTWRNSYQVLGAWFDGNQGAYEAFIDDLHGPANTFNLPVRNQFIGSASEVLFVTLDGEFEFETGANNILVLDGTTAPIVDVTAPVSASVITLVTGADAAALFPGWVFSVNSFLYRVAANDAGVIRFNPPLREAIPAGTVLEVQNPTILVRLESDSAAMAAYEFSQIGAPHVLNVIEAFDR